MDGAVFRRDVLVVLLIGISVLLRTTDAQAQRAIPDDHLSFPVALLVTDGSTVILGTGFFFNAAKGQYLVTAKHVLFSKDGEGDVRPRLEIRGYGKDQKDTTPLRIEVDLDGLSQRGLVSRDSLQDIAVVRLGEHVPDDPNRQVRTAVPGVNFLSTPRSAILGIPPHFIKLFDDVLVSNQVFVFGYPKSLGLLNQLDHARPLLRVGIVAGKNQQTRTIIIDCPVYPGNSGGPVIEVEPRGSINVFKAIGVVTQFVPGTIDGKNIVNSGYAVVAPMDRVLETVERLEKKP